MLKRIFPALLILVCSPWAFAQPVGDRVPADAIIYLGWQGSEHMPAAYAKSHLKGVLDESNFPAVFDVFIPSLIRRMEADAPGEAQKLKLVMSLAAPVMRHPSAFFFAGMNWKAPTGPQPRFGLLCDAGNDAAEMFDLINGVVQQVGPAAPLPIKAVKDGNLVAILVGYDDETAAIAGKGNTKSILTTDGFKSAIGQVGKEPVAIAYIDTEALLGLINQGVDLAPDQEAKIQWPKVRDALGVASLQRFIWTGGFDGMDWSTQCFIACPGPRDGILALLDGKPMSDDLLRAVPKTATSAMGGNFDIAKTLLKVRESAGKIDPLFAKIFDQGLGAAQLALAMNIQKDFLEALGSEWVIYNDPTTAGAGPLGLTLVNRLAKPAEAERALTKLELFIGNAISSQLIQQKMQLGFETTKVGDVTIHYFAAPFASPSWAVVNGNLYMGLYPQVVAEAVTHSTAKGASLLDREDFTALRKRLGGEKASGFSFSDLPVTAGDGYQVMMLLTQTAMGFGDLVGVKSPPMVLPPLSRIRKHLAPAGGFSWTDEAGWHSRSTSPFPGAEIIASQGGLVMAAAIPAGLVMPMYSVRRAAAVQQQDRALRIEKQNRVERAAPERAK